jgi:cell division protein ZapA
MADQDLQSLKVIICGRSYPLKVKGEDVETLQKIVKQINQKVKEFQINYQRQDLQDCITMVLLTYAVDLHKAQQNNPGPSLSERIASLDHYLDELIRSDQAAQS